MGFLGLLLLLVLSPVVLAIAGIVFLFRPDEIKRKKGKHLLLAGVLLFLVEILIGYSICTGMNFH